MGESDACRRWSLRQPDGHVRCSRKAPSAVQCPKVTHRRLPRKPTPSKRRPAVEVIKRNMRFTRTRVRSDEIFVRMSLREDAARYFQRAIELRRPLDTIRHMLRTARDAWR